MKPAPGYEIVWPAAIAATTAFFVVAASNALFAYSLGAFVSVGGVSIDGALLAAGSVALAVYQAQAATLMLRGGAPVAITAPFLALCLAYSVGAMAAHVTKLQRLQEDARREVHREFHLTADALADAARERDALMQELSKVRDARSQAEIQTALGQLVLSRDDARTFRQSDECTAKWAQDQPACLPFRKLRTELAAAIRKEELAPKLDAAEAAVTAARQAHAATKAPAEPTALEYFLRTWLVWTFAIALEVLETFGFALAYRSKVPPAKFAPATPNPAPPPPNTPKPKIVADDLLQLLQQMRAGTAQIPGGRTDPAGRIIAGQRALADRLGASAATVNKLLQELEGKKAVRLHKLPKGSAIELISRPALVAIP